VGIRPFFVGLERQIDAIDYLLDALPPHDADELLSGSNSKTRWAARYVNNS